MARFSIETGRLKICQTKAFCAALNSVSELARRECGGLGE